MTRTRYAVAMVMAALLASTVLVQADAAEPQVIDVTLGSYFIKPDKITVKVGQPVTLKVKNEAWFVPHDLVIKAPDAGINFKVDLHGGKSGSTTFTPTKTGTYKMYCDKKSPFGKNHEEKGMHGELVVAP